MLVQFNDVSKSFGSQGVLRNVSFQINPSERTGLIGANGAGKTTILKLIAGWLEADTGTITRKAQLHVGTLGQIPDFHEGTSVFEEGLQSSMRLLDAEREMRRLEEKIASKTCLAGTPDGNEVLERYSALQHEFEIKGGYSLRARTEAALLGVGFSKEALSRPSRALSGGEKNRLALAKLLLSNADLLLLDEPTNHLDIRSTEWLEEFLKETGKTVLIVSHDRFFLDRVVHRILDLNGGQIQDYRGNYSDYLRQREERLARQEKEWRLQSEWIERQEDYVRRNIAGQKTKQAQSRRKLLARTKRIERPRAASAGVKFNFLPIERSSRYVLAARRLDIGYAGAALVRNIEFEVQRGERWAILGANGSGKTTLLRTLIGLLSPVEGELDWNANLEVGYYDQQLQDLRADSLVLDEIREIDPAASDGELRAFLGAFLFSGDDVFKRVEQLSGGEKSRLMLSKIIYAAPQLLVMDEPTNHLDIAAREALETALVEYPGTILFVTHDRYLVRKIATHLVYLESGQAFVFDRLNAFEQWLASGQHLQPAISQKAQREEPGDSARKDAPVLSKNMREKLQREASEIESKIAALEAELTLLETAFQNPGPELNWEAAHRRYAEIRDTLDSLYRDLESRWELMGS